MEHLRKYIQEAVAGILEEDYNSIKEIKELANESIVIAAQKNFDYVVRQLAEGGSMRFYPIKLLDVYQENPKKYPTLQDFLVNANVMLEFAPAGKNTPLGSYSLYYDEDAEYNPRRLKSIKLYYKPDLIFSITNKHKEQKTFTYKDIYISMYFAFHSTLEHELQHAYDDYRSKSFAYSTKGHQKFREKYFTPAGHEMEIDDEKKNGEKNKDYLKLQHEIWARFTQAVNNTRFYYGDFDETPEGVPYMSYRMHSLDTSLRKFQINFTGWRAMTPKMKKKMLNRVIQYWYKENEELPEKNKQELAKARAYKKEKSLAEVRNLIRVTLKK